MTHKIIDIEQINFSIQLLKQNIKHADIEPMLSVLKKFKHGSDNEKLLVELRDTINSMGITKGAILTYAPYILSLLFDNSFGD